MWKDEELVCLCGPGLGPPHWAPGSARAECTCQIPISSKNSPDGHPTGHVYGMDGHCHRKCSFKQVGVRPLTGGGCPKFSLVGGRETWWLVPQAGTRKWCLRRISACRNRRLSCNQSLRLVRGPNTDPVTICILNPPDLEPTPRPSRRGRRESAQAEWVGGEIWREARRSKSCPQGGSCSAWPRLLS